jgi:tRNA pseudouridine32 synthase / 23S rRNA pseudouridine746 synthase
MLLKQDPFFTPFDHAFKEADLPSKFTNPFHNTPHPFCLVAVENLQNYLTIQQDWVHNFGLEKQQKGVIIGKMFGVLVVKTREGMVGYLAAFSGKLAGRNSHVRFVPPVYDALTEDSFLTEGMVALSSINAQIKALKIEHTPENTATIADLKQRRKDSSIALQNKLFDHYHFLNQAGESKSLCAIFTATTNTKPPSGAGECAAPKLLHYAFQHQMQPLAIAEFWWGLSPKSDYWQHKHFYPACQEKCAPILSYMLASVEMTDYS